MPAFDPQLLAIIASLALLTGILHGATGMAGGIVMASILAHIIGIKLAVPVMTVALILSHLSRVIMYARDTDWSVAEIGFSCGYESLPFFHKQFNKFKGESPSKYRKRHG